ncbi:hypothetical protein IMSHALPRED_006768 [Imshaugia aleurites]|uniref:Killer toxin Kp4 domain-containing protein n=1 Tax=Imshaugia aleurites TaxID=172621 RepID=A0A8H3FLT2_9LECA|nr:hypothetical protein IMSHALPRED_006768 [Imshaugia aleurites]
MHYQTSILSLSALPLLFNTAVIALGINCRGSGLCPRATWNDKSPETIVQALRDAIWTDADSNSTTYSNGDHIICVSQSQTITVGGSVNAGVNSGAGPEGGATGTVGASATFSLSGSIGEGGICVFAQDMASGATIDLGTVRGLTDALLEHGCSTCGSVPIHFVDEGSNDPSDGILTFNYVANPYCIGSCMSASGTPQNNTKLKRTIDEVPRRLARPLFE